MLVKQFLGPLWAFEIFLLLGLDFVASITGSRLARSANIFAWRTSLGRQISHGPALKINKNIQQLNVIIFQLILQ